MSAATLLQWARGQLSHDRVGVSSTSLADLRRPECNIVHLRRPISVWSSGDAAALQRAAARRGGPSRAEFSIYDVHDDLEPSVHELLAYVGLAGHLDARLARRLHQDVCELVTAWSQAVAAPAACGSADEGARHGEQSGRPRRQRGTQSPAPDGAPRRPVVHAKLEVLAGTPCPRWHADHVTARLLCTYTGPGTWFVPNRHVKRTWRLAQGAWSPAVTSVDEQHAVQAGPGDVLLLKGHAWPSNMGLGAVHRSPLLAADEHEDGNFWRVLLTVDDAVAHCSDLDEAHAHQHGAACAC